MIEITEKMRDGIAMSIGSISLQDATEIAGKECVGLDTIYRYIRDMKKGKRLFKNEHVVRALAELAAARKKEKATKHKQFRVLEKQLSGIR